LQLSNAKTALEDIAKDITELEAIEGRTTAEDTHLELTREKHKAKSDEIKSTEDVISKLAAEIAKAVADKSAWLFLGSDSFVLTRCPSEPASKGSSRAQKRTHEQREETGDGSSDSFTKRARTDNTGEPSFSTYIVLMLILWHLMLALDSAVPGLNEGAVNLLPGPTFSSALHKAAIDSSGELFPFHDLICPIRLILMDGRRSFFTRKYCGHMWRTGTRLRRYSDDCLSDPHLRL
jgi:hypothetical protein